MSSDNSTTLQRHLWQSLKHLYYSAKASLVSHMSSGSSLDPRQGLLFLGIAYKSPLDEEFLADFSSRPWLTYRSGFPPIHPSRYTSDVGWGCMLRSGQMMLCNAYILYELGRDWRWVESGEAERSCSQILGRFVDSYSAPFSIHRIAAIGQDFQIEIGQWFGPSTISQVLKVLVKEFKGSPLRLFLAQDGVIYKDQVKVAFTERDDETEETSESQKPKGLLILVPLRLGLEKLNPVYHESIKKCFEFKHTVGIAGGKPNSSLFFLGYQNDRLLYLDPHNLRPCIPLKDIYSHHDLSSYHAPQVKSCSFGSMDPSLVIGFLCSSYMDFESLCLSANAICQGNTPLFTIEDQVPDYHVAGMDLISDDEMME